MGIFERAGNYIAGINPARDREFSKEYERFTAYVKEVANGASLTETVEQIKKEGIDPVLTGRVHELLMASEIADLERK